jgi:hypothetical protein
MITVSEDFNAVEKSSLDSIWCLCLSAWENSLNETINTALAESV